MEKNIIRMITILYRKSQSYLSNALSRHNLTTAEQPFLAALQKIDGATQDELSALISVDKAATARMLKLLEDKGYVTRVQDEQDKRQNRVYLTSAGREFWPRIKNELICFNDLLTENIDATSLDIAYKALLQMEKNAILLSMNKPTIIEQDGTNDADK